MDSAPPSAGSSIPSAYRGSLRFPHNGRGRSPRFQRESEWRRDRYCVRRSADGYRFCYRPWPAFDRPCSNEIVPPGLVSIPLSLPFSPKWTVMFLSPEAGWNIEAQVAESHLAEVDEEFSIPARDAYRRNFGFLQRSARCGEISRRLADGKLLDG